MTRIVSVDTWGANRHRYDLNTQLELTADELPLCLGRSDQRAITGFELYILDRLRGVKAHGDFLDGLNLASGIAACELFGISLLYGRDGGTSGKSEDDLCTARNLAFDSLRTGYDGFRTILSEVRLEEAAIGTRSGPHLYGRLYVSLAYSYRASQFDLLRNEIRKETLRVVPILNGADFFGPITESPWTTIRRLKLETAYTHDTVGKALAELGHPQAVKKTRGASFITLEMARQATELLTELVSEREVSRALGTTVHVVRTLVAAGFLPEPIRSTKGVDRRYSISAAEAFRHRIDSLSVKTCGDGWLTIGRAASHLSVTSAEVLNMIFCGQVKNVARISEADGLAALRVDPADLPAAKKEAKDATFTRAETCEMLKISNEIFTRVKRKGLLEVVKDEAGNAARPILVSRSALVAFDKKFASYKKLEHETALPWSEIASRFEREGIAYVFPDSNQIKIFERSTLPAWVKLDEEQSRPS